VDWRSHLLFSAALSALAISFFFSSLPPARLAALFIAACASSLLPDLDHPKSRISRALQSAAFFAIALLSAAILISSNSPALALISFFAMLALLAFFYILLLPRHRGLTHTIIFSAFFALLIFLLTSDAYLSIFALLGYLSHLLADLTVKIF